MNQILDLLLFVARLLTVAAILPQHWSFRLVDLNCDPMTEEAWAWADLVCCGGMLPQQAGTLAVRGVPCSDATAQIAAQNGVPLAGMDEAGSR